jgi:hypothetical protein
VLSVYPNGLCLKGVQWRTEKTRRVQIEGRREQISEISKLRTVINDCADPGASVQVTLEFANHLVLLVFSHCTLRVLSVSTLVQSHTTDDVDGSAESHCMLCTYI